LTKPILNKSFCFAQQQEIQEYESNNSYPTTACCSGLTAIPAISAAFLPVRTNLIHCELFIYHAQSQL